VSLRKTVLPMLRRVDPTEIGSFVALNFDNLKLKLLNKFKGFLEENASFFLNATLAHYHPIPEVPKHLELDTLRRNLTIPTEDIEQWHILLSVLLQEISLNDQSWLKSSPMRS